jgi:hypothetical protein
MRCAALCWLLATLRSLLLPRSTLLSQTSFLDPCSTNIALGCWLQLEAYCCQEACYFPKRTFFGPGQHSYCQNYECYPSDPRSVENNRFFYPFPLEHDSAVNIENVKEWTMALRAFLTCSSSSANTTALPHYRMLDHSVLSRFWQLTSCQAV